MTAKEIVDFVIGWFDVGQRKRTETFSEAACTGQFGSPGFYNKEDVEDFYQELKALDKMDAVLALKLLTFKLSEGFFGGNKFHDKSTFVDEVLGVHQYDLSKMVVETLQHRKQDNSFDEKWCEIKSLMGWSKPNAASNIVANPFNGKIGMYTE